MEHPAAVIAFGPFRLVVDKRELWKDEVPLKVRALPLAVLTYLAQHPERVIPVEELRKAVWGGTRVGSGAIRVCVREIRQALGDEATAPHYIETVGRQGYCFVGYRLSTPLATPPPVASSRFQVSSTQIEDEGRRRGTWNVERGTPFVGRKRELARLQQWFAQAQQGQRQVVLVSGEPGIGKTTLIEVFLSTVYSPQSQGENQKAKIEDQSPAPSTQHLAPSPWIGHGQCVESYGPGEAYLPILEAIGRLGRELGTGKLTAVLYQHAPTWLAQLSGLVDTAARGELHRHVAGATQERMLRELCDALEVLTVEQPLLLVLEDLQWSDTATLAWVAAVARRPDPARLFVIGTYRPIDVIAHTHPLRSLVQELRTHRLCREERLELLSTDEVQEYVRQRFASSTAVDELGLGLHQRTDGNPLFLTASIEALIQQGVVRKEGDRWVVHGDLASLDETVPEDLQALITKQFEALAAEDQQLLEVASVSGVTFATAEAATGCKQKLDTIEARCEQLARRGQFIAEEGLAEWPDGALTMKYRFRHALYQQVVYARLGSGQKVRVHRLIGERKEAGYGERASEIAAELAVHFEQGRDSRRAVRYRQVAAEQALRRHAYQEVYLHSTAGLALLATLPGAPEHKQLELRLRQLVNAALSATRGFTDDELEANLQRAQQLCRELEDDTTLVSVLIGLGRLQNMRANRTAVAELAQREERLVERLPDARLLVQLHTQLVAIAVARGRHARAEEHYTQVLAHHDSQASSSFLLSFGGDPLLVASPWFGLSLSLVGQPEQGWSRLAQALVRAEALDEPLMLVHGLFYATIVKLLRGDYDEAWRLAHKLDALACEHHFSLYQIAAGILRGGLAVHHSAVEEGMAGIIAGLAQYRALGAQLHIPFFLSFLAEGYRRQGKIVEALQVVSEALGLTATNLDVFWEAELYRQKGELTLQKFQVPGSKFQVPNTKTRNQKRETRNRPPTPSPHATAEACFQKAIEVARSQGAKSLELRAVMSLSRLWQQQGKRHEARNALSEIYHWFTEGFDTQDLRDAKALLEELEH